MDKCNWQYIKDDDAWECCSCGFYFILINDCSPKNNQIYFCPKCGKKIVNYFKHKEG